LSIAIYFTSFAKVLAGAKIYFSTGRKAHDQIGFYPLFFIV